jgi:iron(III) transport system permease protein
MRADSEGVTGAAEGARRFPVLRGLPGLSRSPIAAVAAVGATLILLPLLTTLWISLTAGVSGAGGYTLDNFNRVVSDKFGHQAMLNTLVFGLGSTALAIVLGAPMAWAVARTDLPAKRELALVMGMVLVIPGFIQGIGWAQLLSPTIGIVNRVAMDMFNLTDAPMNVYTLPGMTFVQALNLAPEAFFILLPLLVAMDSSLEEASFMSGVGKIRTMFWIDLPLVLPGISAAFLYLFVLSAALFEIPAVLGFPTQTFVFSTLVYLIVYAPASLPNYGLAAAYGVVVVIAGLALLTVYGRIIRRGRAYASVTGKGRRAGVQRLGKWRYVAFGLVLVYVTLAIGLPVLVLVYSSLLTFFQVPSWDVLKLMSFQNYATVMSFAGTGPILNTAVLTLVVPILVLLVGVPISWVVVRSRMRARYVLDAIAFLPVAIPRVVIAVAILYLALQIRSFVPIYGTLAIIVLAHVIMFLSFATRTLNSALLQIHPELEEAAFVSGASRTTVVTRITAPLLRPVLFFTWFWVLLLTYREVTVAVLLSSPGNVLLPTLVWNRWNAGKLEEAAAASVVLVVIALALMILLRGQVKRIAQVAEVG